MRMNRFRVHIRKVNSSVLWHSTVYITFHFTVRVVFLYNSLLKPAFSQADLRCLFYLGQY